MAVLGGEGDAAAFQQGLHLRRMGGRVEAAEQHLPLPQQGVLPVLQLLHLGDQVGFGKDLLRAVRQLRAGGGVGPVRKTGPLSRAPLDQGPVPGGPEGGDL